MYKPSLKRIQLFKNEKAQLNLKNSLVSDILVQTTNRIDPSYLIIPSKMVAPPVIKKKQHTHLITPLLVKPHKYPKIIKQMLMNQSKQTATGIGGYKEVNWHFKGTKLTIWVTGKDRTVEIQLDSQISCVAIGQLKAQCLPSKIKNRYIIAIGILNYVILYCLNSFTLETFNSQLKYKLKNSLQIQQICFIQNCKLLIASSTGMIQLHQFGQSQTSKSVKTPLYRYLIPVSLERTIKRVEKMLYTQKRIFVFVTEIKQKSWIHKKFDQLFSDEAQDLIKIRTVDIYQFDKQTIAKKKTVSQKELLKRLRLYVPNWNPQIYIKSIFIDYQNDKEGQLGIVTECGIFLTLRNNESNSLSKQPLFVPKVLQLGECSYLQQKALQSLKFTPQQLQTKKQNFVVASLGYENLTLMQDSLLWLGEKRIDGVIFNEDGGQLFEKSDQNTLSTKQWQLFTFNNHYTIQQIPIRHLAAQLCYIKGNLNNEYLGLHYKQQKFNEYIEKKIKSISPEEFLKQLIEILLSKQKVISINQFILDLIDQEIKEEKSKNFADWKHEITPNISKLDIYLNQNIIQEIWSLILQMQYRQISGDSSKGENFESTNVYWLAMHSIYYQLIGPILNLSYEEFKQNRVKIQKIHNSLQSLEKFFIKKQFYQTTIKKQSLSKEKETDVLNETAASDRSFCQNNEYAGITKSARNAVVAKVFHEKHHILQQKIKSAVTSTAVLLSIYFNLQNYLYQNQQVNFINTNSIPTFKDLLIKTECQKLIKKVIITKHNFEELQDLDLKLPLLSLRQDISYLRCINNAKLQHVQDKNKLNLEQIANNINSTYFLDVQQVLQNRFDLKLKILDMYYEKIMRDKEALVLTNTLHQKSLFSRTIFPEQEQQIMKNKRTYYDNEIIFIFEQQKSTLKKAIQLHYEALNQNKNTHTFMINELIIFISGSITLLQIMEAQLLRFGMMKEHTKIEKIKYKYYNDKKKSNSSNSFVKKYIPKELFPSKQQ